MAIVGGGMAGLEVAASLASRPGLEIEVFERGPFLRREHIDWDTSVYSGDEKTRRWTGVDWGAGGGLTERLGGRSLCYHGVLLEIDSSALADWPREWVHLLTGREGAYGEVRTSLVAEFPELRPRSLSPAAVRLGMKHVPQAAYFDARSERFRAYSPLQPALRLTEAGGCLRITRAAAQRLRRTANGSWSIDLIDECGNAYTRSDFQYCVLAASAISNVTLLSQTLQQELTTHITDHLCAGALLRLPPGNELDTFRHRMLWSGYIPLPSTGSNIFVQERAPLPNGDRFVEIFAVIEQGRGRVDYSELTATPGKGGHAPRTYVTGKLSTDDRARVTEVKRQIRRIIDQIAEGVPEDVTRRESEDALLKYDDAYSAVTEQRLAGTFAWFGHPYGSFEHEACSHPIGFDGPLTVTRHLEVEGMPGLYLAGPGNFVRPGAANPALTILAMSRFLADTISTACR
ncbi:hypothetical protein ABIA39_002139 [Nocardia sp. GAS34]|uniref:NAD(P)-binding protein n=1 Tax=unclassified Nocardia TaxID=2637762 RepID=UPI003D19F06F